MWWAPIAASVAGGIVSGAMNKGGGGQEQTGTTITDLPEWLKPYYTGGSEGLTGMIPPQPPLNQDYLYWNQMAGMGMPIGPPPPMYVDNPWYTGENVYAAPDAFLSPMQNVATNPPGGLLGMPGGTPGGVLGAPPGGGGYVMGRPSGPGGGGVLQYPSQMPPEMNPLMPGTPAPAPAPAPEPTKTPEISPDRIRQVMDEINYWGAMEEPQRRMTYDQVEDYLKRHSGWNDRFQTGRE